MRKIATSFQVLRALHALQISVKVAGKAGTHVNMLCSKFRAKEFGSLIFISKGYLPPISVLGPTSQLKKPIAVKQSPVTFQGGSAIPLPQASNILLG